MARRNIVKMGDPLLRKKCKEVTEFDGKLHQLLDDMAETLHYAEGLGLAAPQVGILKRVCIVEYDGVLYELVERPKQIDITYYDRNGIKVDFHAEGYFARVFLHEMDHLDGILFADKMVKKLVD